MTLPTRSTSTRLTMLAALAGTVLAAVLSAPVQARPQAPAYLPGQCGTFTVAMIPDTQNYMDFTRQKSHGFPIDAVELYYEQMRYIGDNARSNGGAIVFATHVGDIWQHYSEWMDPEHEARGFKWVPNPAGSSVARQPYPEVRSFEIPSAAAGFRLIAGKLPFSVVPGNHDYDALWTHPDFPPQPGKDGVVGLRHVGGLTGFLSAFSADSEFFKEKPWYISAHSGGTDSAQIFEAGECRFLHIGLQYDAPDDSLAWARRVVRQNPGIPTIVTIHKYLNRAGKRAVGGSTDLSTLDPRDNNPQMVWDKFISQHDQIFLVLSGHIGGQAYSVDHNDWGSQVHQMLADYQGRSRVGEMADPDGTYHRRPVTGDGWLRLLEFDLDGDAPRINVRTYSTHFRKYSSQIPEYAAWYKRREGQAELSDEAFNRRDEYVIDLVDFNARFAPQAAAAHADR
jgi:hypothetical protein